MIGGSGMDIRSKARKKSPVLESVVLHIDQLRRNVNEGHMKEIFSNFGEIVNVELTMDRSVNLPLGYGYVEFKTRAEAEKALLYMDGAQIDGSVVKARFALPQRPKVSSPQRAATTGPKRETNVEMMSMVYNWPAEQGIGISIGKLDLYVAAAGINPQRRKATDGGFKAGQTRRLMRVMPSGNTLTLPDNNGIQSQVLAFPSLPWIFTFFL